ncbi:hypothetical protein CkaCkLH20_11901 [Colletotrichum karsti]|uniref:Uncharacterized protein n=1 Tax=Colletotrichum karsti TaxID=1095194 RepID=A0A9P6I298_9PEZI|nr:uncharacterized protein CkaCkLH20_11901 [Colletotrichum karsti]KAF9870595.1 hypothetical protein CkaCkLH20_11901 [Colletotrichum karsti]
MQMLSQRIARVSTIRSAAQAVRRTPVVQQRTFFPPSINDSKVLEEKYPEYPRLSEAEDPNMNGGYINPPFIKRQHRDPHANWWDKQERRNFGEPVHEDHDLLGMFSPHEYTWTTTGPGLLQIGAFIAVFLGVCGAVSMAYPDKPSYPREFPGGLERELGGANAVRTDLHFGIFDPPTVTAFVPSLCYGSPFTVYVHNLAPPQAQDVYHGHPGLPNMVEARVVIDGTLTAMTTFDHHTRWPAAITDSLVSHPKTGVAEPLRFPGFRNELVFQNMWKPHDNAGRIKVIISEVTPENSFMSSGSRIRPLAVFSFQHAPQERIDSPDFGLRETTDTGPAHCGGSAQAQSHGGQQSTPIYLQGHGSSASVNFQNTSGWNDPRVNGPLEAISQVVSDFYGRQRAASKGSSNASFPDYASSHYSTHARVASNTARAPSGLSQHGQNMVPQAKPFDNMHPQVVLDDCVCCGHSQVSHSASPSSHERGIPPPASEVRSRKEVLAQQSAGNPKGPAFAYAPSKPDKLTQGRHISEPTLLPLATYNASTRVPSFDFSFRKDFPISKTSRRTISGKVFGADITNVETRDFALANDGLKETSFIPAGFQAVSDAGLVSDCII